MVRGNSWAGLGHFSRKNLREVERVEARATYRLYFPPQVAMQDTGFRCARDLEIRN